MPTLAKSSDGQLETRLQSISNPTPYCQPWWQGLGNNDIPSPGQKEDGPINPATLQPQGTGEGIGRDTEANAAMIARFNRYAMSNAPNCLSEGAETGGDTESG